MKWSKKAPKMPGFYWFKANKYAEIEICRIVYDEEWESLYEDYSDTPLSHIIGLWGDKIEEPTSEM